ncbi:serine-threonine protein kinase [Theileria orientalis]|uniref:Serine-threonine protein kinase n=1 Tax=Theileria orientalis TaxID=68886 RepID=A0A976QTX4_THEOR|nr:serine-threonine protein kinase [Theileria orientalis]
MEDLKRFQTTQIEEIFAIHFIYYPVKIVNYGGVNSDKFPADCMSQSDYDEISQQSKFGTNIKLNENSIKGAVRSELIRFCFKLSASLSVEEDSEKYSLVDVTFPKNYPSKSPFILIKMTVPMSSDDKRRFTSRLLRLVRSLQGNVCVFDVCLYVNEIMTKLASGDRDGMWDEMTTREDTEDVRDSNTEVMEESLSHNEESYDEEVNSSNEEGAILAEDDSNYKYSEIDFQSIPIWSVQSMVQIPVWYQSFKTRDEDGKEFEQEKLTKSPLKSSVPKLKIRTRIIEENKSAQTSITPRDKEDTTRSLVSEEIFFTHDSVKNLSSIKRSLNEFYNETYDRYERDFVENDYIFETSSLSLCSVRHVLDQNLYYIKIFHLPRLCPYVNLSSEDVRQLLHRFRVKRRLILNEIISRVSQLSKLEHNSICRYYQSWLEKKLNDKEVDSILRLCDDIMEARSFGPLFNATNTDEKMILLFKYSPELGEHYLQELVTERDLFIQIQNFDCHTMRYEIENNNLHKNQKLIWSFIRHLLDVLTYLHQNNVYHQCLSVDNIYVHTDVYGTGLKLSEFGITHLGRKLFSCENECNRKSCECQEYKRSIRKHLYQSHPSSYGVNPSLQHSVPPEGINFTSLKGYKLNAASTPNSTDISRAGSFRAKSMSSIKSLNSTEFDDMEYEEVVDPYLAVQEDMFALGLLIFRMWHPPLDENSYQELLVKVVNTQTFPDYFLESTPPIIITTLTRLLGRDRRPTAIELIRETLVPPVMDIYMYKQYLRKLENPVSEESLDALRFLLSRDWNSDVSKYRHSHELEILTHNSYVADSLERFMRGRGVIIRPPLPLQIKTYENNDKLLGIDGTNTLFSVGGSIRRSLLRSFELYAGDESGVGIKQFSVGDVHDEEKCVTGAVFSITTKVENDLIVPNSVGKRGFDYKNLDDNCILMISSQVDLILVAIESMLSLSMGFEFMLTITFQPLIVDFISLVLKISTQHANVIFCRLQATDINEYTFNMLLEEYSIEKVGDSKNLVDLLGSKFGLIEGLKRLHRQVLNGPIPKQYHKNFVSLYHEIHKLASPASELPEFTNADSDSLEDTLVFERYYRRIMYTVELAKMLHSLSLDQYCLIEFVLGVYYTEICDYSVDFPFFLGFMSNERKNLVMTGGCYGTNTFFMDETNVSKILHFDIQYFLDDLIKLSIKDARKIEGYTITPTKTDRVDVVITCQTAKLLPAATSIANKLIDSGISCECRAIPLIFTGDFNLRLRTVDSVKARVHLQKLTNISSEDTQLERSQSENADRNLAEEDIEDKTHLNILYHVEPINGSFGQARKIDNEVALVHFIIGQLT